MTRILPLSHRTARPSHRHTPFPEHTIARVLTHVFASIGAQTHERMWREGGGGAGELVVGAALSACLFIRWRRSREGGRRCKIYLLPSENFDPGVVNLSKESSQLNRKHEEEGGMGGGGWMFLGSVGGGHTQRLNHFKRGTFRSWGIRVYNPETDTSQPASPPLQKQKVNICRKCLIYECFNCLFLVARAIWDAASSDHVILVLHFSAKRESSTTAVSPCMWGSKNTCFLLPGLHWIYWCKAISSQRHGQPPFSVSYGYPLDYSSWVSGQLFI